MRRPREEWILDDLSTFAALACDDPAESLARIAVGHGDLVRFQFRDAEAMGRPIQCELARWHARNAARFANAALDLDDLYAGDPELRRLRSEE